MLPDPAAKCSTEFFAASVANASAPKSSRTCTGQQPDVSKYNAFQECNCYQITALARVSLNIHLCWQEEHWLCLMYLSVVWYHFWSENIFFLGPTLHTVRPWSLLSLAATISGVIPWLQKGTRSRGEEGREQGRFWCLRKTTTVRGREACLGWCFETLTCLQSEYVSCRRRQDEQWHKT